MVEIAGWIHKQQSHMENLEHLQWVVSVLVNLHVSSGLFQVLREVDERVLTGNIQRRDIYHPHR